MCEGGDGRFCGWEGGWVNIWTCGVGVGGKRRGPYRGKDATEGKTETMYVSIAVGVVLHRGRGGVVGVVVRLVEQRGSEERMEGWNGATDWLDGRSRVEKTMLTIILRGESRRYWVKKRGEQGRRKGGARLSGEHNS